MVQRAHEISDQRLRASLVDRSNPQATPSDRQTLTLTHTHSSTLSPTPYITAVFSNMSAAASTKIFQFKLVLLGESAVGKSSLVWMPMPRQCASARAALSLSLSLSLSRMDAC